MSLPAGAVHWTAPFLVLRSVLTPVTLVQTAGILLGAWGTWLTAAASLWNWPVNIAGSLLFAWLFCHVRLYGAAAMQALYVLLGVIGWLCWLRGGRGGSPLPLSRITLLPALVLSGLTFAALPCAALCLLHTHDAAPVGDACALVLSLAGQYLVTMKLLENWYLWMAADAVYVALSWSQDLPMIGGLYVLHLVGCGYGLWRWRHALGTDGVQSLHP